MGLIYTGHISIYVTLVCLDPLVGLLIAKRGPISDLFADFQYHTSHTGLPCPALIHGEVFSFTET